jgi:nucleotide-binding universal stress UspA family protein
MKILAILTNAASVRACLDASAAAARSLSLEKLEVLYVMVDPSQMVAAAEEINFQLFRELREGTAEDREVAVRAAYEQWMENNPSPQLAIEWKEIVGREEPTVLKEAQAADVLILVEASDHNLDAGDARHAAIFQSGKPLLLVPPRWKAEPDARFGRIAVGINRGKAARHAVAAAEQLLRAADHVIALRVGEDPDPAPEALLLLQSWGLPLENHHISADGNRGADLVRAAGATAADLLVVGAYRHSEVLDWLLPSTTRQILHAANLPLVVMH